MVLSVVTHKRQSEKEAGSAHGVTVAAGARTQSKDHAHRAPTKAMREWVPGDDSRADPTDRFPKRGIDGEDEGDEYDDGAETLPHGMADLRRAMTV